jgi:sugar O-acyltransferase (sialic acid O-acetyltransferase NeuD family)
MNKRLVMLGGGGHSKALRDVIESIRDYSISLGGRIQIGYQVQDTRKLTESDLKKLVDNFAGFVLGVGQVYSPENRVRIAHRVVSAGGKFVTLISPFARVSPRASIGTGTVIMHGACVNYGASIGDYCIINTGANVEHDAIVGRQTHISTGSVVNGDCDIGSNCFVGSNSVVLNEVAVIANTMVGAGSVVTKDIAEPGGIYVGNPAKLLKKQSRGNS